mgnify:CR=1 FL=1
MRSREPWRLPAGQSRAVPFLQAAVLFAALCIFARSAALVLAAFLAAPVPAAQTLLHLGQQAVESRAAESSAESAAEAASAPSPAQEAAAPVQTGVEQYFVALQPDEARPADAGAVTEQQFGQGSGEKYIPCGAGSIKNNTRQTAADIAAVARACEDAGADGVSLINTLPGMRIDLARRRPLLANQTGGMSGPGVFPLAVRMVYQVYEAVRIPIVGMGGVTSAQDVLELMLAGATAVGVGAANLVEPYACKHIIETLPDAMARFGIDNLRDIIGGAHHG